MAVKIIVPAAGQITNEFRLLSWRKQPSETVKKGEILFEIETDKAALEVESSANGTLIAIFPKEGETVREGEIIGYIGEPGEPIPGKDTPSSHSTEEKKPVQEEVPSSYSAPVEEVPSAVVPASPAARYLSKKQGIVLRPLYNKLQRPLKRSDVEKQAGIEEQPFTDYPLSPHRLATAKLMEESARNIPQFSLSIDIDMSEALHWKDNENACISPGRKRVSIIDIIMRAIALTVDSFPGINASFNKDCLRRYHAAHIGLAVATDRGLVVPVLRSVKSKSLPEIAQERSRLVERALQGNISENDLMGGTITLSNLGTHGIDYFTALVNPPQSTIIAVGKVAERVVCAEGKIFIRPMMRITASYDHRIVDGAEGAGFLQELKALLEEGK